MLETYSKQSYQYLFDALVDDLINRGKPYLICTPNSDHGDGGYDLNWPHGEPRVSQQDIDLLIGAIIDEAEEWPKFIWDSQDYDSMQTYMVRAFRGTVGAPQLGHSLIKAARKHYSKQIHESLPIAIYDRLIRAIE